MCSFHRTYFTKLIKTLKFVKEKVYGVKYLIYTSKRQFQSAPSTHDAKTHFEMNPYQVSCPLYLCLFTMYQTYICLRGPNLYPHQSKKEGKDQESIQSRTTPGYQRGLTTLQLDVINVSPFRAGEHKASINRRTQKHNKKKTEINDPQKKHRLGKLSKNMLLEGLNRFHGAPTSPLVQMLIKMKWYM